MCPQGTRRPSMEQDSLVYELVNDGGSDSLTFPVYSLLDASRPAPIHAIRYLHPLRRHARPESIQTERHSGHSRQRSGYHESGALYSGNTDGAMRAIVLAAATTLRFHEISAKEHTPYNYSKYVPG